MTRPTMPTAVLAMAARGPDEAAWVDRLPRLAPELLDEWKLTEDGEPMHGFTALVLPVRTSAGAAAVLKLVIPGDESEHEHLALQHWHGDGAVRLLRADPARRVMLLERLRTRDLTTIGDIEACEIVAGLYGRIHVPALPQLRTLTSYVARWHADLGRLSRDAPLPRRLVEQALALGADLVSDESSDGTMIHGDLHYENVLAADREPWLVIDPKPMSGDPHYEVAPLLWNRWEELSGPSGQARRGVRQGIRSRFFATVDAAGLDEDRARAWVVVRMVHNALWEIADQPDAPDEETLTVCVAIAKAMQG